MPAQMSTQEIQEDDLVRAFDDENNHNQAEDVEGSDRSPWSSNGEKDEYVTIRLSDIRKEVQCPICLGIIRKTRTVMECLHRFCRECIDKSMRLGNNECPACRTHCASRRSLRDDPNFDALIAVLYPDIDEYEEEELAFQEEEKARNKQIQAFIAQTMQRQTEALSRKRTAKATETAFVRRSQGSYRNTHPKRRRNPLILTDCLQDSDDIDDANGNEGGNSSSSDERIQTKPKRCKERGESQVCQSVVAGVDRIGDENDTESNKEPTFLVPGLISSSDRLSWGKGGTRSRGNGKNSRSSRLLKLVDHLRNSEKDDGQMDIHLMLVSCDNERVPSLKRPFLCCRPTLSVKHLCEYVAIQTELGCHEVQLYLVKEPSASNFSLSFAEIVTGPVLHELQPLREQETIAELQTRNLIKRHLILGYKKLED